MLDFLRYYNRPQKYQAEIQVNVRNTGTEKKQTTVVIPVPMTTDYQITMPLFEERTLQRELTLAPGHEEIVSIKFEARVQPRRCDPPSGEAGARIREANEFVLSYLTYGNPIKGLYTAKEAREKKIVDCGGFDTLLQEELKNRGIESKVVAGFWNTGGMHAWLEINQGPALVVPADPSVEQLRRLGRTKKSGQLGFVGSDRIAFSTWKPGEQFLQHPFVNSDTLVDLNYENYFFCTRA